MPKNTNKPKGSIRASAEVSQATYFVSLRHAERMMLKTAFETFAGDLRMIGEQLGVTHHYIRDRMFMLGGCTDKPEDAINEPPLPSQYTKKTFTFPRSPRLRPGRKADDAQRRDDDPAPEEMDHGPDQPADELERTGPDLHVVR